MKQTKRLEIRLSPQILQDLDVIRGKLSRAEMIRQLIKDKAMSTTKTHTTARKGDFELYNADGTETHEYAEFLHDSGLELLEFSAQYPDSSALITSGKYDDILNEIANRPDNIGWTWSDRLELYKRSKQQDEKSH